MLQEALDRVKQQQLEIKSLEEANTLLVQQVKTNQLKEAEWKQEITASQKLGRDSKAELERARSSIEGLTQQLQEKEQGMLNLMQEHRMQTSHLEHQLELDQQLHVKQISIKENQLKAMMVAQEMSKRRL